MDVQVNPEVNVLLKVCKQKDETIDRADALISELRGKIESKNWDIVNLKRQVNNSQLMAYETMESKKNNYYELYMEMQANWKESENDKKMWKYRILDLFTDAWVLVVFLIVLGIVIGAVLI